MSAITHHCMCLLGRNGAPQMKHSWRIESSSFRHEREPETETEIGAASEKCGETDHAPLAEIKRLKKNLLRQLECFFEGFEDLDFGFSPVHRAISIRVLERSKDVVATGPGRGRLCSSTAHHPVATSTGPKIAIPGVPQTGTM